MFFMQQARNVPQDDRARSPAKLWPWIVLAVAAAAAAAWLGALQQPAVADSVDTPVGWGFAAGALLCLAGAVLAWFAGAALARERQAVALHDARCETQALMQMLDVWHWQSDETHRLVRWQPPQAAPASAWAGRSAGQPVWERFDARGAAHLRERMQAQAAIADLVVEQLTPPGSSTRWQMRGVPRLDASGRFSGYIGTARRIEASQGDGVTQQLLWTTLEAVPAPVLVLDGADPPRILRTNEAAARWLGRAVSPVNGRTLAELLTSQSPELRDAVTAALESGSAHTAQWQLRCSAASSAGLAADASPTRTLVLRPNTTGRPRATPRDAVPPFVH
jgi:PAS domain-containing protein